MQTNRRDIGKALKGGRNQIMEVGKHDTEGARKGLVLKICKQANNIRDFGKAWNGARPQITEASEHDPEGACKGLVLKLRIQANKQTRPQKGMQKRSSSN